MYVYDDNGSPVGMMYRNSTMGEGVFEYYIFAKNLQGDITAVYDEYGGIIVEYTYDAWGNVTETLYDTTSNGQYNSFRYRGYFYDEDTGLYYLNSRYYDPAIGRFINADVYVSTGQGLVGYNMYAYCNNNPISYIDPNGDVPPIWAIVAIAAVVAVVVTAAVVATVHTTIDNNQSANPEEKKLAKKYPISAYKGMESKNIAEEYQAIYFPNTPDDGQNEANAFKHAMWNAVMTDKMGYEKAKMFADAHEAPFLTSQPELCKMDLFNNELGRKIAVKYAGQGYDVFAQKIYEAIEKGEAYVIKWSD